MKKIKNVIKKNQYVYRLFISIYTTLKVYSPLNYLSTKSKIDKTFEEINPNKHKIYHMNLPIHGNLGDSALALSQINFLKEKFPDSNHIIITSEEYQLFHKKIKKNVEVDDFIVLIGGGSVGNEYLSHEKQRRIIIETFKQNKIISFPQSIYFSNDKDGNSESEKSRRVYSAHTDLLLFARDPISFEIGKNIFPNTKLFLVPDIVYSLDAPTNKLSNDFAGLFIRNDLESNLSEVDKHKIEKIVRENSENFDYFDTKISKTVKPEQYESEVRKVLNTICGCNYIVTDRLHGVIFAIITQTPVFIFSNYNHKIKAQLYWLKDFEHVYFCESIDDFESNIKLFMSNNSISSNFNRLNLKNLKQQHEKIIDVILN